MIFKLFKIISRAYLSTQITCLVANLTTMSEVSGLDARANVLQKTAGSYMETTIGQISGECDLFQILLECFVVRGCCYFSERYV